MPGIGDLAPQFSGNDVVTGEPFSLAEQQGNVVLIAFSGLSWCPPCQFEAPVLQDLWEEYDFTTTPHVRFVTVSWLDQPSSLLSAIQQFGLTMPVLSDPAITTAYEINSVPRVYVVGVDGKICGIKNGASPPEDVLRETLRQLLVSCGAGTPMDPSILNLVWAVPVLIKKPIPEPDPPWESLRLLSRSKREALIAMAVAELAGGFADVKTRRTIETAALDALVAAVGRMRRETERAPITLERTLMTGKNK